MMELALEWREALMNSVSDADEDIMIKFLEGEEISSEEIKEVIRRETIFKQYDSCFIAALHTETRVFR